MAGATGLSSLQDSLSGVRQFLAVHRHIVLKAPWSSSGRGVRFVEGELNVYHERWVSNVIDRQGCIVAEPYYNKVKDFGMEFESDGQGRVRYLGLSLFHTTNGAYTGNVLADEEEKKSVIYHYLSERFVEKVKEKIECILGEVFRGKYRGPLGVDMMIVAGEGGQGFLLHPCVEINLRRTMGHVALELSKYCSSRRAMMVEYLDNVYKLKVRQI